MGTLANGIKDIFATSQTTATHLPVCASDGTPQGRIAVADLASVLGAITQGGNLMDAVSPTNGIHYIASNAINLPDSIDSAFRLCVSAKGYQNHLDIFLFDYAHGGLYYTHYINGSGRTPNWMKVALDIPSFYKNYNSLSALTTALNFHAESLGGKDCDTLPAGFGAYYTSTTSSVSNLPNNYDGNVATLFHIKLLMDATHYRGSQFVINNNGKIWMRYFTSGDEWTEWTKILDPTS